MSYIDDIIAENQDLKARLRSANDLAKGYADQNARFAKFVEDISRTSAEYYGYVHSLLRAGRRAMLRLPRHDNPKECDERAILDGTLLAVEQSIDSYTPAFLVGALAIVAERVGQVTREGATPEHDVKNHTAAELATAGTCYLRVAMSQLLFPGMKVDLDQPAEWPWTPYWWKPADYFRNVEKGCALLAAAYDRRLADLKLEGARS